MTVFTRKPTQYLPDGCCAADLPDVEVLDGVLVRRLIGVSCSLSLGMRLLDQLYLVFRLLAALWTSRRSCDVLYVLSPPLLVALPGCLFGLLSGTPVVLNLHDLYPQAAIDLGVLRNPFLIWLAKRLELFVYRSSTRILVAAPSSVRILTSQRAVQPAKVEMLWNFVDPGSWGYSSPENEFRRRHGLSGRFVIMYAGQLGLAQDLDLLIDCARSVASVEPWIFIVIGDGPRAEHWKARANGLENILFLSSVSTVRYFDAIRAADVGLALLSPAFHAPAIPGKIQTLMAVGRPVLAAVPPENDTHALLAAAGCGLSVPAGDRVAFLSALFRLVGDPALRNQLGQSGLEYARSHFATDVAVRKTETVLSSLANCSQRALRRSQSIAPRSHPPSGPSIKPGKYTGS